MKGFRMRPFAAFLRGGRPVWSFLTAIAFLIWTMSKDGRLPALFSTDPPGVVSFAGRWVQIEQPSVEDLLTFYGPRHGATCRFSAAKMEGVKEEHKVALAVQRAVEVGSYRWILDRGQFEEWDPVRFIERLIMSRLGLVAIGDSLTVQMMEACKSLLMAPIPDHYGLVIPKDRPIFIDHKNPIPKPTHFIGGVEYEIKHSISSIGLNPHHPVTDYLKAKHPEIPSDRWDRPLAWTIFNDYGLTPKEMDQIMRDLDLQGENDVNLIAVAARANRGDWPLFLKHMDELYPPWTGALKDVVVLSTGAHWPGNFAAAILRNESQAEVMYPHMVSTVLDNFSQFAATTTTMIRSGYRGHPECGNHRQPWSHAPDFGDVDTYKRNGWYTSPGFDRHWISRIGQQDHDVRTKYLDLRDMEGLRPDGHQEPDLDCLHVCPAAWSPADAKWCAPYVPSWWIRAIWHTIDWSLVQTG